MEQRKFVVVGGGIVGLATAYRLTCRIPGARVTVLEKEGGVGRHQTGHNSGVLHCGLYYKPGSVKARLAVTGIRQMVAFCQENGIPHEVCGKLVVAADVSEIPRIATTRHGQRLKVAWLEANAMRESSYGRRGGAACSTGRDCRLFEVCRLWWPKSERESRGTGARRLRETRPALAETENAASKRTT
jgi:glycine/D-amino acid oxidase-like deaminating enzyme